MSSFHIEKSTFIQAPPEKVFGIVRDLKKWQKWSPWIIIDPDCKLHFEENDSAYRWEGEVVTGSLSITSEKSPQTFEYELHFTKPHPSSAKARFDFEQIENGTKLIWAMEGSLPFYLFWMKKMISTFVGMDYERGLRMLKPFIEKGSHPSRLEILGEMHQPECRYVSMLREGRFEAIGDQMSEAFKRLLKWLCENDIKASGPPFSIDHHSDIAGGKFKISACIPIDSSSDSKKDSSMDSLPVDFKIGIRPEIKTFAIAHTGPYEYLGNAWAAGMFRVRGGVFVQNKKHDCFEVYENDPDKTPAESLRTLVHFPMK